MKKVALIVAIFAIVFLAFGCSSPQRETTGPPSETNYDRVEIREKTTKTTVSEPEETLFGPESSE